MASDNKYGKGKGVLCPDEDNRCGFDLGWTDWTHRQMAYRGGRQYTVKFRYRNRCPEASGFGYYGWYCQHHAPIADRFYLVARQYDFKIPSPEGVVSEEDAQALLEAEPY